MLSRSRGWWRRWWTQAVVLVFLSVGCRSRAPNRGNQRDTVAADGRARSSIAKDTSTHQAIALAAPARPLFAREPRSGVIHPWQLRKLIVDVHVEHNVARVTLDLTLFNPAQLQLEGLYGFELPAGASISRLAMYVDGKLMEGGVSERQHAANTYEGIVERRRDPALLEHIHGRRFGVRAFPLAPRAERRLLVSYLQVLPHGGSSEGLSVPLPGARDRVAEVQVHIHTTDADTMPTSVQFPLQRIDAHTYEYEGRWVALGTALQSTVAATRPATTAALGHAGADGEYLWVRARPEVAGDLRKAPRRWVVLYDTSGSRDGSELAAQRAFVVAFTQALPATDWATVIAVDSVARAAGSWFKRPGELDVAALDRFLRDQGEMGAGATDLAAGLVAALKDGSHVLYVGDGAVTDGATDLVAWWRGHGQRGTVIGALSGDAVAPEAIKQLAATSGGWVTELADDGDPRMQARELLETLERPRVHGLAAALLDDEAKVIPDAQPLVDAPSLAAGDSVSVLVRGPGLAQGRARTLALSGTVDGQPWSSSVPLPARPQPGPYLPHLWGRARIDAWLADGAVAHRREIIDAALHHGLVSPLSSLIVLESEPMYARFHVRRRSNDTWARYRAPERIGVPTDPSGASDRDIANRGGRDGSLLRTPPKILAYPPLLSGTPPRELVMGTGEGAEMERRRGGSMWGAGTIGLGLRGIGVGGYGIGMGAAARIGGEGSAADDEVTGVGSDDQDVWGGLVAEDPGGSGTSWQGGVAELWAQGSAQPTGQQPHAAARASRTGWWQMIASWFRPAAGAAPELLWPYERGLCDGYARKVDMLATPPVAGQSVTNVRWGQPRVVGYDEPKDPALDDLTAFVPGLWTDRCDQVRATLGTGSTGGGITDDARALIDSCRAAVRPGAYRTTEGVTVSILDRGRVVVTRTTPEGLQERSLYDDGDWTAHYPELDLAVRRHIGETAPLLLAGVVPWMMPDADHLARWYRVRLSSPGTVELQPFDSGADALKIELDEGHRIVAVRQADHLLRVTYGSDGIDVEYDGERRTFTTVAAQKDENDLSRDWTVVQMPLQPRAHWERVLGSVPVTGPAYRAAQVQRMATAAATGDRKDLAAVFHDLRAQGTPMRAGEIVLASGGYTVMDRDAATQIAGYMRDRSNSGASAQQGRGLVATLSQYRSLLATVDKPDPVDLVTNFVKLHPDSVLSYALVRRASMALGRSGRSGHQSLWTALAKHTKWRPEALLARALAWAWDPEVPRAADDVMASVRAALAVDAIPSIDLWSYHNIRASYGEASVDLLWAKWRAAAQDSASPWHKAALVAAIAPLQRYGDMRRVALADRSHKSPDVGGTLALIEQLARGGLVDEPWWLVEQLLPRSVDDVRILEWAAVLAELRGSIADAIAYKSWAMALHERRDPDQLRSDYRQLLELYVRVVEDVANGGPRTFVEAQALDVARRWRAIDPESFAIDRLLARFYADQPQLALRHLLTIIDRHPEDANAHVEVAQLLVQMGQPEQARRMWARAVQLQPTDPTWQLRYAELLIALDEKAAASKVLGEITSGTWRPRFSWVNPAARALARAISHRHLGVE